LSEIAVYWVTACKHGVVHQGAMC